MLETTLTRQHPSDQGTEGEFVCPAVNLATFTLELPWRNNQPCISCIPPGTYICRLVKSPKFGMVFQVLDVEGRTHILHHSGNFAGDKEKGFRTHVLGCILHGLKRGYIDGQQAVLLSRNAMRKLHKALGNRQFKLTIKEAY